MWDVGRNHRDPLLADSADRLDPEWLARNRLRLFRAGSTLIPKSGASVNLNHRAMLATDAYVVSHLAVVTPDRTRLDPEYLFWWSVRYDPRAQAQVTSLPSLKLAILKEATLPLPPLEEQRRIVAILNRAAKIERLRARAGERLREFSSAVFVGMFGDPVENLRGWDVALLGEVIQGFEAGKNVMAGNGTTPLRILKVSAVTSGEFDPSMSKPAPDDYVAPKRHRVRVGDLLISRANTSDLVGATAMVEREAPDVLLPDKIWRFVWQADSSIEPRFVHGLFQNRATRGVISAMASGTSSSMKNVSQAKLKKLRIIVPPLERQKRYAELVARAREVECRAAIAGTRAEEISASLMTELSAKH